LKWRQRSGALLRKGKKLPGPLQEARGGDAIRKIILAMGRTGKNIEGGRRALFTKACGGKSSDSIKGQKGKTKAITSKVGG